MMYLVRRNHLRSFLDGASSLTLEEVTSELDCQLGQWLYSDGVDEMLPMEEVHTSLHHAIENMVKGYHGGNSSKAEHEYEEVIKMSGQVAAYLDSMICSSRDLIVRTLSDSQLFYARADIMLLGIDFRFCLQTTLSGLLWIAYIACQDFLHSLIPPEQA